MEGFPTEILLRIFTLAGNLSVQRQVCGSFNQLSSVLLLQQVLERTSKKAAELKR